MDKTERLTRWTQILESDNPVMLREKIDELLDDVKNEVREKKNKEIDEFLDELKDNLEEGIEEIHEQTKDLEFEDLLQRQRGYGQLLQWYIQEKAGLLRDVMHSEDLLPEGVKK